MKIRALTAKQLLLCLLLAVVSVATLFIYAKEEHMSAKVMMYYGAWSPEEVRFDATRWFSSGVYRPRLEGTPAQASPLTMLRDKPESLQAIANDVLLTKVLVAIEQKYPKVDTEDFVLNTPDLRRQIRYAYSAFSEPDKPVDSYWLFVTLQNDTYVVTLDWDVTAKQLLTGAMASHLVKGSDEEVAYLQVQNELAKAAAAKR